MTRRVVVAAVAALAIVAALPGAASAHPLGNFTTNHYIGVTVSADTIDVDIVVDVAEIPSIELLGSLDTDADGTLADAETDDARRSLCAERLPEIDVRVDSRPVDLELWAAGVQQRPGAGGLATIRIVCEARAANPTRGEPLTLEIVDGGSPGALGWREIVVRGDGYETDPPDAGIDVAARLTSYPTDLLSQPLAERSATVVLRPGGPALTRDPVPDAQPLGDAGGTPSGTGAATVPGGVAAELPFLPDFGSLSVGTGLIGLFVAAIAGAGHALSPGHGKTVMAAYLVGTRGRARHAVLLGAAVTLSHTLGVLALGGVVLFASDILPAERLYPVLGLLSGAAVVVIGAWLLIGCLRRMRAEASHARAHEHGHPHGHEHAHGHDHPHEHAAAMPGIRGLLAIGIAGGLVPSTAALVLLLAAVAAGQAAYGLALALAFGAGMAAVLTGIGLAIVQGRQRLGHRLAGWNTGTGVPARLAGAAPWAIAVVVLVGGVLLTGQALAQTL